jgi:hypothetical protein
MSSSENPHLIDRREALRRVSALLGGVAMVGGTSLLSGCARADERARDSAAAQGIGSFTPADIALLDEVAETILPETATPGAKAAKVGAFIALMVTDTYEARDQEVFRAGMQTLEEESRASHQQGFMASTPEQRLALLTRLDREAKDYLERRQEARRARDADPADTVRPQETSAKTGLAAVTADAPNHYFRMIKELTMLGYFTSEIGYTKAMRYVETPGRFDPCLPYTPGEVSWAPHA